jgi:hypothetical protein
MKALEWTFVVLGVAAGLALAWFFGAMAWRLLRGPRP